MTRYVSRSLIGMSLGLLLWSGTGLATEPADVEKFVNARIEIGEMMTNYFKGARGKNFPPPVARVTSDHPLWDWAEVARWMFENNKIGIEQAVDAEIYKSANEAISHGNTDLGPLLRKRAEDYERELEAA